MKFITVSKTPTPTVGARKTHDKPDPNERIELTLILKSPDDDARKKKIQEITAQPVSKRRTLTREQYCKQFGATPEAISAVAQFCTDARFAIQSVNPERRSVTVSGRIKDVEAAFGIEFELFHVSDGSGYATARGTDYRSYQGEPKMPATIGRYTSGILGLDDRQVCTTHMISIGPPDIAAHFQDPAEVARYYDYPPTTGKNQCIGIILLGGGFYPEDIDAFFQPPMRRPRVSVFELGGQTNSPASHDDIDKFWQAFASNQKPPFTGSAQTDDQVLWTIEAALDIQLAASFANGADLAVYIAPNTVQGKFLAFSAAITDGINCPAVINCSFGASENDLSPEMIQSLDGPLKDAALMGITVVASSGDTADLVSYPASSLAVLGCGGTHLEKNGDQFVETPWIEPPAFASAGGPSACFQLTPWQKAAGVGKVLDDTARGVPDVCAKADLRTGYRIQVAGLTIPMGGTSAAAPTWAALVARMNEAIGKRVGYLTSLIYEMNCCDGLQKIEGTGDPTKSRWVKTTGLGRPIGTALLKALQ